MNVWQRILAGLTLLLAAVVLLLFLAGAIGVWIVREPLTTKATGVFKRIDAALDVADQGLGQVKTSLARAAQRLGETREEQRKLAAEPVKQTALTRLLARTVQQKIMPDVGAAQDKLHTVAEAAVVVNTVLEDIGDFGFLSAAGLDLDRLNDMNSRLTDVGPAAWELSRLLGDPEPDADAGAQLSRVEKALQSIQGSVADYERQVKQARERTDALKSAALPWITPAAILISLVCCWVALSQVIVIAAACSWWKQAGLPSPHV